MRKLFTYAAALAMTFGLTVGIYAASGGAIAGHSIQTEQTVDDTTSTPDGDDENPDGDDENPDGGGSTPDGGGSTPGGGGSTPDSDGGSGGETPPTPEPYTFVGDGSLISPYTAEDVRNIDLTDKTALLEGAWVKAVVFGYVYGTTLSETTIYRGATPPEGENIPNTLLLIDAAHQNDEVIDLSLLVPISLGGSTEANKVLSALNLNDHPQLVGTALWLCGSIGTLKGVNGLRNIETYSQDGTTILPEPEPVNVNYNIWVGGTQVTSENASNITSDELIRGTASYDYRTNTLTLTDTKFEFKNWVNAPNGVQSSTPGLTIVFSGINDFNGTWLRMEAQTTVKCVTGGRATFGQGYGINASGQDILFEDAQINISSGSGFPGINCNNGTLTFKNSNISITANTPVFLCRQEPTYIDCHLASSTPSDGLHFDTAKGCYVAKAHYQNADGSARIVEERVSSIGISNSTAPVERKNCELSISPSTGNFDVIPGRERDFTAPTATCVSGYDGVITYTSSDPSIISVNSSTGALSYHKSGTVVITVTASETANYNGATKTYRVSYNKLDPQLTFGVDEYTVPMDGHAAEYIHYPTYNSPGRLTYSSSNTNVIWVDNLGGIHVANVGTAVLTATVSETDTYYGASVSCTIHVVASMNSALSFADSQKTVYYGETQTFSSQTVTAVKGYTGKITYSSSNTGVASVDSQSGEVTLIKPGTTTIRASGAAVGVYTASTASYTINFKKGRSNLTFKASELNCRVGDTSAKLPDFSAKKGDGAITYSSNNMSVCKVDAQSGALTIVGAGKAVIKAVMAATDYYESAEGTCTVTVTAPNPEEQTLQLSTTLLAFNNNESELTIDVISNTNWAVQNTSQWCTVTASVASGNGTITVKCLENTEPDDRMATFTVKSSLKTVTVTVTQSGTHEWPDTRPTPTLSLNHESLNIMLNTPVSEIPLLVVRYNGDGELAFTSSEPDVLTVSANGQISFVGVGEAVLTVTAAETEQYVGASKSVAITVKAPDPDPVEDVEAKPTSGTISLAAIADKDLSTGGVLDNVYYLLDPSEGINDGYDTAGNRLVINSVISEEQMAIVTSQSLAQIDDEGKFRGIIFKLPAGAGKLAIDYQTGFTHALKVQIGNNASATKVSTDRTTHEFAYNNNTETYVYVSAVDVASEAKSSLLSVRRRSPQLKANSVLIYGISWIADGDGISGVKADTTGDEVELYTVGGQRIAKKNAHGGVFVGTDGSKRAVK